MAGKNGAAAAVDDEPEPTLREQLEDARDQVLADQEGGDGGVRDGRSQSGGAAGGNEPAGAGGAGPAGGDQPGAASGRARDGSGRFAKGGAPAAPASGQAAPAGGAPAAGAPGTEPAKTPAELAAQDAAAGKVTPDPTLTADPNLAPRLWSQAAKAEWAKLPETVRKEIAHREQAMHRQITAQDQEREIGRSFRTTVNQYADVLQSSGVHPVRLVDDALKVIRELQNPDPIRKASALGTLARQYGIDPRLFAGAAPGGPAPAPGAPGAAPPPAPTFQLPPAVAQMTTEWNEWKTSQARAAQEAQEAMATSVMTEIQGFQADPKNVYFDQVKDHMRVLLAGGAAQTLQEAYDQAIYARPDIRDRILAERDAAAQKERDKALEVERAKRRGVSVRGRGGGAAPTPSGDKTLRETLQENFAAARSRV